MTIPKIVLDKQNDFELLQQAYLRVSNASNGVLNASQPGSALMAFLEGQVYLTGELLWFVNLLPEALALEVFRLTGVERSPGTKAVGTLTVYLDTNLATPFILSKGTVVDQYILTDTLYIAPGFSSATVPVEARGIGSAYNRRTFGLSVGSLTTYMSGATNVEPISGGSDLESLEAYIERVQRSLRQRDTLVSLEDYQTACQEYIPGSVAITFPLISANKTSKILGNVHAFVAYPTQEIPANALLYTTQQAMQERVFIGSSCWVSAAEYYPVYLDIVASADSLSEELAQTIFTALQEYMQPGNFPLGGSLDINELEYVTRQYVKRVSSCFINGEAFNVAMPTYYTYPQIDTVSITLVDNIGRNATFTLGTGIGDPE